MRKKAKKKPRKVKPKVIRRLSDEQKQRLEAYYREWPSMFAFAYGCFPGQCRILMRRHKLTADEIDSIGWMAAMHASYKFIDDGRCKFSTFIALVLRGYLSRAIDANEAAFRRTGRITLRDFPIKTYSEGWMSVIESVIDKSICRVDTEETENLTAAKLHGYLKFLPKRLGNIIRYRFGIECKKHTYKEIGEKYHFSVSRVGQLVYRGLRKLKNEMKFVGFDPYAK